MNYFELFYSLFPALELQPNTQTLAASVTMWNVESTNVWEFICAWFFLKSYLGITWIWSAQKCSTVCWFSSEEAACQESGNTLKDCECSLIICIVGKDTHLYYYAYEYLIKRFFCVLPCKQLEMMKCLLPLGPCKHDIEYL